MIIINHRVNTVKELNKTPKKYGVEIDIRGFGTDLILNHEPLVTGERLEDYLKHYDHKFIIFNIKETGIENRVIDLAEQHEISDYFLLDVEFPFLYKASRKEGFHKIATRFSEVEPIEMSLAQKYFVDWVWIDTNTYLPLNKENYMQLRGTGFKLCLVSPEAWGRSEDVSKYVDYLKQNNFKIDAVMTSLEYADKWEALNS